MAESVRARAPRRGLLIYNPLAGGSRRRGEIEAFVARAPEHRLVLTQCPTVGLGSATEIVRRNLSDSPDLVVVAGGDGTVGDVAAALVGTNIPLAILPTGTVNVVAREYGIERTLSRAFDHLGSTRTRPLTVWAASGRPSLISAGIGFDARVMKNTVPILKRLFGRTGIAWTATLEWMKYEFPPIAVEGIAANGTPFSAEATFVLAANTSRYGGDAILSPHADPEDDLLDLVLFGSSSRSALIRWYGRLARGKSSHLTIEKCTRFPIRSFNARSLAGYELDVQVDGDAVGSTPFSMGPAIGTVQVVVPE